MPRFFIDRPIFAWVISILILVAGALSLTKSAGRAISEHRAAVGGHHGDVSGRVRRDAAKHGDRRD